METNHKTFNAFDKVLVRDKWDDKWQIDLYSHFDEECKQHITMCYGDGVKGNNILSYKGNEHLVGTTDEPEEELELEEGEWLMVCDTPSLNVDNWCFTRLYGIIANTFQSKHTHWRYAIRFKNFNPYNMEETTKHILYIKNNKVVEY